MKTIYVFAEMVATGGLKNPRRTERLESQSNDEVHVATVEGQPDNYWELVANLNDGVTNDP